MNKQFDLEEFLLVKKNSPLRHGDISEFGPEYVKAWLEYKIADKSKDPDQSEESRSFYELMWGNLLGVKVRPKLGDFSGNPSEYVQGDWMCSIATTFRKGLVLFVEEHSELRSLFPPRVRDGVGGYRTYAPILVEDMNKAPSEQKFQEIWGDVELQKLIRSAYTFANLIIVPDGFNSARTHCTEDYWDRTLYFYFAHFNPEDPLFYKGTYDVGTPFHALISESLKSDDALFLAEWLDHEHKPIMLPNKNPKSLNEWRCLIKEMTKRIENRRYTMSRSTALEDK